MGFLDSVFNNEKVRDLAFGTIKKMAKENGIQFITLEVKPNDEIDMQMYKAEDQPVIVGKRTLDYFLHCERIARLWEAGELELITTSMTDPSQLRIEFDNLKPKEQPNDSNEPIPAT